MTDYKIPDDLRAWCEATAPVLTTEDWWRAEWVISTKGKRREDMPNGRSLTHRQARALLAYADEVAAGLRGIVFDALSWAYMGERDKARDARLWATPDADTFVTEGGDPTDYGRYIAGRAAEVAR